MIQQERTITIGRDTGCDVVLTDSSVSHLHARLSLMRDGKMFLVDCTSTNGTWLLHHGKRYPIRQEHITVYDTLQFGEAVMTGQELVARIPSHPVSPPDIPDKTDSQEKKTGDWNPDARLVRCVCGAVKQEGSSCDICGR